MASSRTWLIAVAIVMVSCADVNAQDTAANDGVAPCAVPLSALQTAAAIEPLVREMCRRSLTFRRQLIRLADAPGLAVTVAIKRLRVSSHAAAITRFAREQGLLRRADIEIGPSDNATLVELIAHEVEHVLEQLDDVNLTQMTGSPGVMSRRPERKPSFETARARRVGLDVAGEFKAGPVAASKEPMVPR